MYVSICFSLHIVRLNEIDWQYLLRFGWKMFSCWWLLGKCLLYRLREISHLLVLNTAGQASWFNKRNMWMAEIECWTPKHSSKGIVQPQDRLLISSWDPGQTDCESASAQVRAMSSYVCQSVFVFLSYACKAVSKTRYRLYIYIGVSVTVGLFDWDSCLKIA